MNSSNTSQNGLPSENETDSENESVACRKNKFEEPFGDESSREYSESSVISIDEEFGPETSQAPTFDEDNSLANKKSLPWVSTFKERLGTIMDRLLNDSLKFCISGPMNAPPTISISLPKVRKHISFPLYDDMMRSIIPAFEQSAFGRGTETIVDTTSRNSWELSHADFEILNPEWHSYLMDVLLPLIQQDLSPEVGFRLALYKLLLYQTGSFFKPHRDSEKEDGMFGTVVIQLPSFYEGGKLIVQHDHRKEEVDFSSAVHFQNAFSVFYTAFYCDCEHEVLPVTAGIRACLVYNLVLMDDFKTEIIPSASRLQLESRQADSADFLRNAWPDNSKMIYCLAHKYSQKNLSLANLKSSDRIIGQFFQKYAKSCDLEVMIGILKRKKYRYAEAVYKPRQPKPRRRRSPNHMYWYNIENGYEFLNHRYYSDDDSDELETISDVDSNDPTVTFYDYYKIKYLKSLDTERSAHLPALDVFFESEVLPENRFRDIKAFYDNQEVIENEGVRCSKYYRCAAIMVYRHEDLLPIIVKGDAKLADVEETFLNELGKYNIDCLNDEIVKKKCLKWSHALMDRCSSRFYCDNERLRTSLIIVEYFLQLDDIELMRRFLNYQNIEKDGLSFLLILCQKYGWSTFSADIISKFGKLKPDNRFVVLQKLIEHGNDEMLNDDDKQILIHSILKEMLTKFEYELEHPLGKNQRADKIKAFLISLWPVASNVNFVPLTEYAESKPMDIVVPALISIAHKKEKFPQQFWLDVANHFKLKMEIILEIPIDPTFTWKQNVKLSCHCKHCHFVDEFLQRSFQQTLDFFGKKLVRGHVQQTLNGHDNLMVTTKSGVVRIKKQRKTGEIQSEKRNFVEKHLSKLSALIAEKNQ